MAIAREAGLLLTLMRSGAPNSEILLAKSIDDLFGIARKYDIALPTYRSSESEEPDAVTSAFVGDEPSGGCDKPYEEGWRQRGLYEGERNERGEWEGIGRYTFGDGSVYEGQWWANRQEGHGTFWYASGNLYDGQWRAGKFLQHVSQSTTAVHSATPALNTFPFPRAGRKDGRGTFGYADGRVEVGTYVADTDVGEGAMWSSDRRTAWRILQDGLEVAEISIAEAKRIAERIGEGVPAYGDWLAPRVAARQEAATPAAARGGQ